MARIASPTLAKAERFGGQYTEGMRCNRWLKSTGRMTLRAPAQFIWAQYNLEKGANLQVEPEDIPE